MYMRVTYDLRRVREVTEYYPGNYGAPGCKRGKKRQRTPEDIARQNATNRAKKLQRILLLNFKEGDWHLILRYRPGQRPDTYEDAQAQLKKFMEKMRRAYKKAGCVFKWVAITERGKKGQALHHHLIIEDIATAALNAVETVRRLWAGTCGLSNLYEDGDFEQLADYITKMETKEENTGTTYSHSRNLTMPVPVRKKMHGRKWREPKPPRGWYVVKSSLYEGINPVTQYPYRHYTMKPLDRGGGEHSVRY